MATKKTTKTPAKKAAPAKKTALKIAVLKPVLPSN